MTTTVEDVKKKVTRKVRTLRKESQGKLAALERSGRKSVKVLSKEARNAVDYRQAETALEAVELFVQAKPFESLGLAFLAGYALKGLFRA